MLIPLKINTWICSNRNFKKHTSIYVFNRCEFLEIEPGTPWSDSECGVASLPTAEIIAGVLICFFLIGTIAGVGLFMRKRVRTRQNLGKMTVFVPFIVFIACDIQFTLWILHVLLLIWCRLLLFVIVMVTWYAYYNVEHLVFFNRFSNTYTGMFGNLWIYLITLYYFVQSSDWNFNLLGQFPRPEIMPCFGM